MSTQPWWRRAHLAFLDLIFPPRCRGCNRAGQWFCDACITSLAYIRTPFCAHCGQELNGARECAYCRHHPLPSSLNGLRAVAHHEGALRKAIHALKYERMSVLAEPLGGLLANYLAQNRLPFTLIMPVPLHEERQRERGYNQSELLAQVVSARIDRPLVVGVLIRERRTPPQVGLNESERRQNLINAFRCARPVTHERVLLIDDVCTTGATLSECAAALCAAGAMSVWGLTLAR
jgi:ComF family protein